MSANQVRFTVANGADLCIKCKRPTKTHARCKKCSALIHYGYRDGPDPAFWYGVRYKYRDVCCPCVLTRGLRVPDATTEAYVRPSFDYGG